MSNPSETSLDSNNSPSNNIPQQSQSSTPSLDSLPTDEFLRVVGLRVRRQRATSNMSRKRLAEVSGVSERYLAQLESGQGNMSIALLRKVTSAISMSLGTLLSADIPESASQPLGESSDPPANSQVGSGNHSNAPTAVGTS